MPAADPRVPWDAYEEEELVLESGPVRTRDSELGEDWAPDLAVDTSDVHLEELEAWSRPDWVITSGFVDEDVRIIRTGKEADVWLVRRTAGRRSHLLAVKRFRPRSERGFRREDEYRGATSLGDERVDRAVRKRTGFGRAILEYAWAYNEFPALRRAWNAGVRVPYPVEALETGVAMQFIGDGDEPAPRLSDIRLAGEEAEWAFTAVIEDVRKLLDVYLVHGDLSAFNILWWDDRPWLIDMPQAADISLHPRGVEFLRRDIRNVCTYFRRCGVRADPEDVFAEVMESSPFAWNGTVL